jgi:signal peptidase
MTPPVESAVTPAGLAAETSAPGLLARLRLGVFWLIAGLAAGLLISLALPTALGGRALTVLSGSMSPAIETGDVVAVRGVRASEVAPGEVITFTDPEDSSRLITHRIADVQLDAGKARFVTKGDANRTVERWTVPSDGELGRVMYRVPKLGYLAGWTRTPALRFLLLALPVLLLAGLELRRIWTSGEGS